MIAPIAGIGNAIRRMTVYYHTLVFTYNYVRFVLATLAIAVTVHGTRLTGLQYYGMRRIR